MAEDYEITVEIAAPPEAVWAVIGDPLGVPRWYPTYVDSEVEGGMRRLHRADGVVLEERLLERDDATRYYSYEVVSGVPLRNHHASFRVEEAPGGSRVVWTTRGETPDGGDIRDRLEGRQREALEGLRALLEG
jgi:mxaD protein